MCDVCVQHHADDFWTWAMHETSGGYNTESDHQIEGRQQCASNAHERLSAHQSATSAGTDSPICVIPKKTNNLFEHSPQRMLELLQFLNKPKYTVGPLLFTWDIMETARGQ